MNSKNLAHVTPRPDLRDATPEVQRCLAISTFGNWELDHRTWPRFAQWLYDLSGSGISYTPTQSNPTQGRLHWTLQQCMPFDSYVDISGKDLGALKPILDTLAGVTIQYRGIVLTPAGIALRGFPATEWDYERILTARSKLEVALKSIGIPYTPPYVNTICHSTVFRWTEQPTDTQLEYVRAGVLRWDEAHLATIRPYQWDVGYMTLRCRQFENQILQTFHTPLKIAHRGLSDGPNLVLENTVQQLESNARHHVISECDIWYTDTMYFLGHDAPTIPVTEAWIIHFSPWLLIHAKTAHTFHRLNTLRTEQAIDLHIFYHTDEDIVLTTHGCVIVYPGFEVLPGWMSMMPERAPHITTRNAVVICSDYL